MAIVDKLQFKRRHLTAFSRLFRKARKAANVSQLTVAQEAFHYEVSHSKVSRIERAVMPKVDAIAIERMARVFGIPRTMLEAIDPEFSARIAIATAASAKGFWGYSAKTV